MASQHVPDVGWVGGGTLTHHPLSYGPQRA